MVFKKTEERILRENKDVFDALKEYDKTGKLKKLKKKKKEKKLPKKILEQIRKGQEMLEEYDKTGKIQLRPVGLAEEFRIF